MFSLYRGGKGNNCFYSTKTFDPFFCSFSYPEKSGLRFVIPGHSHCCSSPPFVITSHPFNEPAVFVIAAAKVTGFFIPAIVWEAFFSNVSYLLIHSRNPLKITSPNLFLTANPLTQSPNERALLAAANVMAFLVLRN